MTDQEIERVLELAMLGARMKRLPRTGWLMRGVDDPESIAAHSQGVSLYTLLLLEMVDEPLDRGRALAMAVLHDLPEAVMGDVPAPAMKHLPAGAKATAEVAIMSEITDGVPFEESWRELWSEFAACETAEAKLVRDADKLDMFTQAVVYARSGHRDVDEFWQRVDTYPWTYPVSRRLLEALRTRKDAP